MWGCSDTNDKGEIIEVVIAENDLYILNEKQATYLHPSAGNCNTIDSFFYPNIYLKNLDHGNPLIQQFFRKYNYLSAFKEIVFLLASKPH